MELRKKKQKNVAKTFFSDSEQGDAYTYLAIKRETGLLLAFVVGKWHLETCNDFYDIIAQRSELPTHDNKIGICTDGNDQNKNAMLRHYREDCINYGLVIKDKIDQSVIGVHTEKVFGNMPFDEIRINNIDGLCSALRERLKFAVRDAKTFAKKRKTIRDLVGIYQAYHNLIKTVDGATPCMKEGITANVWSWEKLFRTRLSYV